MRKKILYTITQTHYGGAQKYVHDLALSADKNQYEVFVAVGEGRTEAWLRDLEQAGTPIIRLKHLQRNLAPLHDFLSGFELFRLYKKIKPDIIHLNSSKTGAIGSAVGWFYNLGRERQAKIIYTIHGLVLGEPLAGWRKIYYWSAEKIGAMFKHRLICVSTHDQQAMLDWLITQPEKITMIHNGIDLSKLNFLTREEARARLSLDNHNILIGTVAGLYKTKGLNYLIEAASQVINNLPQEFDKSKIKFIIIGDGPEKKRLEKLIDYYKLQANILLAGQIDEAQSLLKAFDAFVLASVKEGLSYTLLEARAAGLPIITTKVGGNPEIIQNNKTGILIEPADPEALAKEILTLIKHKNIREKLSENTRQNLKEFSLTNMIHKTLEEY